MAGGRRERFAALKYDEVLPALADKAVQYGGTSVGESDLSSLGLTEDAVKCYADHGIVQLFPWQRDCLCLPGVLAGERNLVYAAPTSAGKTLVAEIILLKRVLETGKRGLFILPFISVAKEKLLYLHSLYRSVGIQVQGYMGTLNPAGGMHSWDVAVCTIEKANSLVNRLLEEDAVSSLGIIVVDELHLVKDRHRGKILELLLSKLLYHVKQQQCAHGLANSIQIIGMSATLPNIDLYSKWLRSEIFRTDFRPVPLTEYLFSNGKFYAKNFEFVRSLPNDFVLPNDNENVVGLCLETVLSGCGVLVFCSTKAWCERLAVLIAEAIKQLLSCSGSLTAKLSALIESEKQRHFMDSFLTIAGVMDPVLRSTLPYAVGFHHAGLTMEERERLENGFRKSLVRILVATSTLSSGVNLPAKRVIIRAPWGDPTKSGPCLDSYMYKQMTGRAGRKGLDTQGRVPILLILQIELPKAGVGVFAECRQ
uniref:RNA helicase n=1 Tax=Trichuris muris TaxID=70415 RepID=A0A5S6QHY1_TRIMR